MKLIAYVAVYNEAEYIYYSLKSIYDYVDQIIIIEGSWNETYKVSGHKRSCDGTLDILKDFPDPLNKIQLYHHNEENQLKQRNLLFRYLPNEEVWCLLLDADEIYAEEDIKKIKIIVEGKSNIPPVTKVCRFKSLIFVNDFYHFYDVEYARLFKINKHRHRYTFNAPNELLEDDKPTVQFGINIPEIRFFHYSYCKSKERFIEKRKERIGLHGEFAWDWIGDKVERKGASIREFAEEHPQIMKTHPKYGKRIENISVNEVSSHEVIIFMEHSGIGNLVLATPMLKAIRQIKPTAHIYVSAWERSFRILQGASFINLIHTQNPNLLLGSIKRRIDHLIISPVGAMQQWVEILAPLSDNIHFTEVGIWGKHEAEYKMDFARKLGYKGETPACEIHLFADSLYNAEKILIEKNIDKFITINASYLRTDHWHMKHFGNGKFAELLPKIHKEYSEYKFIFVGTTDDIKNTDRIITLSGLSKELCINTCGQFGDIKDCAALIQRSSLCFGNDGGLQHIAAALGVPTVTVFTFTNPIKNRPLGNKCLLVMKSCDKRTQCQHGQWSQCDKNGCLDVSVDEALEKVRQILDGQIL